MQRHLNRVQAQIAILPLLGGLEHQRQRHHVGPVQPLQRFDRLGMVLPRRTPHQGKPRQRDRRIHQRSIAIPEILIHRLREIQPAGKHRNHPRPHGFEFRDDRHVMGIIPGHQMGPLQHQPDARGQGVLQIAGNILAILIPIEIFFYVLEHLRRQRMPDAHIRIHHRVLIVEGSGRCAVILKHVLIGKHQQEILQIIRGTPQPVLEAEHEIACVLGFVDGHVFQHLGQGAQQLEHPILERRPRLLLALAHELGDRTLRLTQLRHREAAHFIQAHHGRH